MKRPAAATAAGAVACAAIALALALLAAGCDAAAGDQPPGADSSERGAGDPSEPSPEPPPRAPSSSEPREPSAAPAAPEPGESPAMGSPGAGSTTPDAGAEAPAATAPPTWLGARALTPGPEGYADAQETPAELRDRRLVTVDLLSPPADAQFAATVEPVPNGVAARSTWTPECPVALEDLRYVTVTFRGFDEAPHTGELLVHAEVADGVVGVFRQLYEAAFPIEEMRIVTADELDAPPTGDGNNTTAFVCRPAVGSASWSQHAFGLAVDVNPFHNPYAKGEVVLPELATAYTDRSWERPGMITAGDAVTEAFGSIGWEWGGVWNTLKDWMHFSRSGR